MMDYAVTLLVQVLGSISILILISLGLAVVFGMMRVINIAHGEFLMIGAYSVVLGVRAGLNVWLAMLVLAPLVTAIFGLIIERLVLRHLYARMIDSLLATWGLSLLLVGAITAIVGNSVEGVSPPLGQMEIGRYTVAMYYVFLVVLTVVLIAAMVFVLRHTRWGLLARGAMQNADMAAALGASTRRIYMTTFAVGAGLSGLAGGVLAPLTGVVPTMGANLVAKAFITVVGGGTAIVGGTAVAAAVLGSVGEAVTVASSSVWGEVAMLSAAVALLRVFPQGLSGLRWERP